MALRNGIHDALRVLRFGDRPSVANDDEIRIDGQRGFGTITAELYGRLQRWGGLCTDAAAHCQARVDHDDVRPRLGHSLCLVCMEDIRGCQKTAFSRIANHVHFESVADTALFHLLPYEPVKEPHGWKVLHPCKA